MYMRVRKNNAAERNLQHNVAVAPSVCQWRREVCIAHEFLITFYVSLSSVRY